MVQQGTQTVTPPPTDPDMLSQPTVGQRAAAGAAPPPSAPQPSTPAAAPAASGPAKGGDEPDSKKYRLMAFIKALSGGGTPAINASLEQHYARQRAQAQLAEQQVQQLANAYAAEKDPAKREQLAHQWETAKENYLKVIGKDKNAKGIGQKTIGVLEKLVGHGGGGMTGGAAGAASPQGGGGGGSAPAASGSGGGAAPTQQGSQTVPPPPQLATAPKPTVPPPPGASGAPPWQLDAMGAPERERERLAAEKEQGEISTAGGKKEAEESASITGLRDGLKKAGFGDEEVKKILTSKFGGKPHITTKMEPDPSSPTGFSWVSKDAISGEEYSREINALPTRSLTPSDTDTTSTDPFGNVSHTHSERKPQVSGLPPQTGVGGAGGGRNSRPSGGSNSGGSSGSGSSSSGKQSSKPTAPSHTPALDADGHVPAGSANPQVAEAANQLLDGTDKDKLPMKVREPAAALARRYGWEQGKFTPKEQVMLREATTFLQQAANDPSLAALDAGFTDRMQLAQVLANPDKEGMIGRGMSTASAQNMDAKQTKFVEMYNQLVGTISGLAQLVRSGRATEATIDRLKSELPNPVTTKDSKDGRDRIRRLLKEIDVAMAKGSFEGTKNPNPKAKVPPPPSGNKSIDDEIMEAAHAAAGSGKPQ